MKHLFKSENIIFFFLAVFILSNPAMALQEMPSPEKKYIYLKEKCKYPEALSVLESWTLQTDNPVIIESNIFKINELLIYPELYEMGLNILKNLKSNLQIKKHVFILSRIDVFINLLLLKTGQLNKSEKKIKSLGFMKFHGIGPFPNRGTDDFNSNIIPLNKIQMNTAYKGKDYNVSWFRTAPDRTGKITAGNWCSKIKKSCFYFFNQFKTANSSEYYITIGKTGFTDIWLDGEKIFFNRNTHGFLHDQYFVRVFLEKGFHNLMIKTGDSSEGIKLSIRLTDISGNTVLTETNTSLETTSPSRFISAAFFKSLQSLLDAGGKNSGMNFHAAYLLHVSGISLEDNRKMTGYLDRIQNESPYKSQSLYYKSIAENNLSHKEIFLKKSLYVNPNNLESLNSIISLKLENGFFQEASELIKKAAISYNNTFYHLLHETDLCILKKWPFEAIKTAGFLKETRYPSAGKSRIAQIEISRHNYTEAINHLEYLQSRNKYDFSVIFNLLRCYRETGQYTKATNLMYRASVIYPDSIRIRIELALLSEIQHGSSSSLPYLSSAARLYPFNSRMLFYTGLAYRKTGHLTPALYFLKKALKFNPSDHELKTYIRTLSSNSVINNKFTIPANRITDSAVYKKYQDEPALVLLDETFIRLNIDGTSEKKIHKIYRINREDAINKLKIQSIILNPATDLVENLKCFVINQGNKIEITDRFKKSLSDPDSRLYYDLEAIIIPVTSLKPNSILDISYTLIDRSNKYYGSYFGEKLTAGGKYRTLVYNVILDFPKSKKIKIHTKKIKKHNITIENSGVRKTYNIRLNNIPPVKDEAAMPHNTEILPVVYFTTHTSWNKLYRWYKSLLRNRIKLSSDMISDLKKIVSPHDKKMDKIKKIYRHVTERIRYVGFEFGLSGLQPRESDLTYLSRMGDCKDVALVLVAMLRKAGINAEIALIRTKGKGPANLSAPYIGEFNHAICYVNSDKKFFLDGTSDYTGYLELPSDDTGVTALVIGEKKYSFINTDTGVYPENTDRVKNGIKISENGNARIKRTLIKQGNSAAFSRNSFQNEKNKMQSLNEYWNRNFPGAKTSNLELKSIKTDKPVEYSYSVDIPSFAQIGKKDLIFRAFLIPSGYYRAYALSGKRITPVIISSKFETRLTNRFIIPQGYKIYHLPESEKKTGKNFKALFNYTHTGNTITVSSQVKIRTMRIPVAGYSAFREFTRFINRKELEMIVLIKKKKTSPGSKSFPPVH